MPGWSVDVEYRVRRLCGIWALREKTYRTWEWNHTFPLRSYPRNRELGSGDSPLLSDLLKLADEHHIVLEVLVRELVKVAAVVAFRDILLALPVVAEETSSERTGNDKYAHQICILRKVKGRNLTSRLRSGC